MFAKILSWFQDACPYCQQKLVVKDYKYFFSKDCPDGHYRIETHPLLETQIEYHN
jgi:hypothetical protein